MVTIGIKGRQEEIVTAEKLAKNVGSGIVGVYATAMMVALMEKASLLSLEPYLEPGEGSVGTQVNVSHCSATPLGMKVWAESEVVKVEGRRIFLTVKAFDEDGLIGEGTHERFIINMEKFHAKAQGKLK